MSKKSTWKKRTDAVMETLAMLLWEPLGFHKGARIGRVPQMDEQRRRVHRKFKDATRDRLSELCGNGAA